MALDAVVFPQDLFGFSYKDLCSLGGVLGGGGGGWSLNNLFSLEEEEEEVKGGGGVVFCEENLEQGLHCNYNHTSSSSSLVLLQNVKEQQQEQQEINNNNSSPEICNGDGFLAGVLAPPVVEATTTTTMGRRKRRRTKSCKNKEEVENQRMTHIAVERNRRRQMNEYLAAIRSLMPPSYVQRGDQASIIGGAINFVKELEQLLQSLEGQKQIKGSNENNYSLSSSPFADFFTFPQYSSSSPTSCSTQPNNNNSGGASNSNESSVVAENRSAIADIEVTMVESHANLKVLSKKRPKQLLKMVSGFQSLRLTILHLNVTTVDQMVLYSLSVKVEEDCQFTSVDEIATAVYQLLGRIQEEISIQQQGQQQIELKKTQTLNFQM